ncbi:MAG: SLBB domain-containing protein [Ignavibacteriales bacterium]|nr:SLBB domain-containing protein [Ignavibacteriales bacterium]
MKKILLLSIIAFLSTLNFGQVRDYELGAQLQDGARRNIYGGYYDYSDPEAVNMNVSVWGFVRYPGRYVIPDYTSVVDLMSYVGGPTDDSNLDELRIYRIDENNTEQMIPIDFNDLMWEDNLESKYKKVPQIKPGDILVVPGEPRLYFLDWFSIGLSVFSALISLTILILTIDRL